MLEQVTIPHGQQWGYVYLVLAALSAVLWLLDGNSLFSSLLLGSVHSLLWLFLVIALVYFTAFLQD